MPATIASRAPRLAAAAPARTSTTSQSAPEPAATSNSGALDAALARFFPAAPVRERALFCLSQLALAEGVYPMTHLSDKQERAMEQAGFPRPEAFGTLFCEGLLRLMSGFGG